MDKKFDPNKAAIGDGIFGLPFDESESSLIFLPVPWEATTSYGAGTSDGPQSIFKASSQIDLFDLEVEKPYTQGMFMLPESEDIRSKNIRAKYLAQKIIAVAGEIEDNAELKKALAEVNELSKQVNEYVYNTSAKVMRSGKTLGLVGGDHSCPLGAFKAAGEHFGEFGILHFDAHSDTRDSYEGFTYSHASIMRNALEEVPQLKKLIQIGIRDFCEEEYNYTHRNKSRVKVFYDTEIQRRKMNGINWTVLSEEIVDLLPEKVWISFDIDGLDPRYCPNTGTPVPGGLELHEANYLFRQLVLAGKKIIGFDLCEVAPGENSEWDANVGMRLLYKMAGWTLASQGKINVRN